MTEPIAPSPADPGLVYVVEHDEGVRDSIHLLLELHDLRVTAFKSFSDFRDRVGANPADCALIDLETMEMTSAEPSQAVDWGWFPGSVVVMSGQSDTEARFGRADKGTTFLRKPFAANALIEAVTHALDTGSVR